MRLEEGYAVADDHFSSRVVIRPRADLGEKLATEANDGLVDLHLQDALYGMLQDPSESTAIPTADNQHLSWGWMSQHRHVHQHLVICGLVRYRGLNGVIEYEHPPERNGVQDLHMLILRLLVAEQLPHFHVLPVTAQ